MENNETKKQTDSPEAAEENNPEFSWKFVAISVGIGVLVMAAIANNNGSSSSSSVDAQAATYSCLNDIGIGSGDNWTMPQYERFRSCMQSKTGLSAKRIDSTFYRAHVK